MGAAAILLHRGNVFLDARTYGRWAQAAMTGRRIPYRDFSWEYPPAALPAMVFPLPFVTALRWLGVGSSHVYTVLWAGFMLATDAAVALIALPRWVGRATGPAHTLWLFGLPLLGALTWARYDLLPASAALAAVISAGRMGWPRSGLAAGVGGALKLWPALLSPIQRTREGALRASAVAAAVLLGTGLLTFAVTGHSGYSSVWSYQSRRGLQVESLVALPLIWLMHLHAPGYGVHFRFGAWEVGGPGARELAMTSTAVLALGLAVLGWAHWRFMRRDAGPHGVSLTAVAVVLLVLISDKVFSPQYLVWLTAVLVAACALDPETWRPLVPAALTVSALTAVEFPWLYGGVLKGAWNGLVVLSLRDLIILGMAVFVGRRVLVGLRSPASVSSSA